VNRDIIKQVLRDHQASRHPDQDPELEALRTAILLEDIFDVALSDAEIDPAVLADSSVMAELVARLGGAV
jgi:hypothetical protein